METFIYIEPSSEGIDSIVKQMAIKISRISPELRGPLKGICIGNHLKGKETQLKGLVDEVMMVEVPPRIESNTEVITKILTDLVKENGPGILFLGFTFQGMELGPAVGWRLQVPVMTNCSAFEWNKGEANVTRPIYGGKLLISSTVNLERGAVISVQKGAWKEEQESVGMNPVSIKPLSWRDSWVSEKTEVVGVSEAALEGEEDITKAQVLVSVGRGLGDPENLPIVKELADRLGAMISSSRPVVDLGWLPASRQVGISGRTVGPVIYLALGISGQTNHLTGISPSTTIIAVNKDPSAPIFNAAKYGIVDDLLQFVPEFLQKIKQRESIL